MASAAALTIGRVTIPVYEIYKAGEAPRWLPGLDLLQVEWYVINALKGAMIVLVALLGVMRDAKNR